jgi:hypothetical protein
MTGREVLDMWTIYAEDRMRKRDRKKMDDKRKDL